MKYNFEDFKRSFPDNRNERFEYPSVEECEALSDEDKLKAFEFLVSRVKYKLGKDTIALLFALDSQKADMTVNDFLNQDKITDAGRIQRNFELCKKSSSWKKYFELASKYQEFDKEAKNLFWLLLPVADTVGLNLSTFEELIIRDTDRLPKIQGAQKLLAIKEIPENTSEYADEYRRLLGR